MTRFVMTTALVSAALWGGAVSPHRQPAGTIEARSMLEMTFPEFEAAMAKTDIALVPIGTIEEHGPHLPLGSDAIGATAQLAMVGRYLNDAGIATVLAPPLNIGITSERGDWTRDGTYFYPGSLTIGTDAFVAVYVDLLHSLRDNGVRHAFLYSGHLGGRQLKAVARIADEAGGRVPGIDAWALIDSERLAMLDLAPTARVLPIEHGLNFPMLTRLLGRGSEEAASTHADGWETSLMLFFRPDLVRPGYASLPDAPSSRFFAAGEAGDRGMNPNGMGGFPVARASASAGKTIADYRARLIGDAIRESLGRRAATPAASVQDESPEAAVRRTVERFHAAFNSHSFDRVAEFTADDWNHLNPFGGRTRGRQAVLKELHEVHATFLKGASDTIDRMDVRFTTPDVAVATVTSHVSTFTTPDGATYANPRLIRTFVVARRGGRWLIVQDQATMIR
ncbi:MAG TPA: SgcJ/EcaC family oxidoreductase [Vicinamibacterales bacterium]|nr:SgcJ/EcaC family oxidoreductase [Vicinamibacterales bacterium]